MTPIQQSLTQSIDPVRRFVCDRPWAYRGRFSFFFCLSFCSRIVLLWQSVDYLHIIPSLLPHLTETYNLTILTTPRKSICQRVAISWLDEVNSLVNALRWARGCLISSYMSKTLFLSLWFLKIRFAENKRFDPHLLSLSSTKMLPQRCSALSVAFEKPDDGRNLLPC